MRNLDDRGGVMAMELYGMLHGLKFSCTRLVMVAMGSKQLERHR